MAFPLTVGARTFPDAPAFAAAVIADAERGGSTVLRGQLPSRWVAGLVRDGRLSPARGAALVGALLQTSSPAAVAEAARLAAALGGPSLAELLRLAVDGVDAGLLLSRDPLRPAHSVEDALLRAWASLADLSEPGTRAEVLLRLRNAGLPQIEAPILARYGGPDEIREHLVPILREGLPDGAAPALLDGLERGGEVREALDQALAGLSASERTPLWVARQQR